MVEKYHRKLVPSIFRWINPKRKKREVDKKGGVLEKIKGFRPRRRKGFVTIVLFLVIIFVTVCSQRESLWYKTVDNLDNKSQLDRTNECELAIGNQIKFKWKTTDSVKRNP